MRGREGLRELYVFDDLCDVSTTSPTALTSWKARVLEELYRRGRPLLRGPARPSSGGERLERHQAQRCARRCPERGEREFLMHYLDDRSRALPVRERDPQDVVRHSRFARQAQMQQVNVTVMTTAEPYVELALHRRRHVRVCWR